jgi:hypothetical protein
MTREEWRTIKGFSSYRVSNLGRVRSIDRRVVDTRGRVRNMKGRVLKEIIAGSGYLQVTLSVEGKLCTKLVHRLVAEAFAPNPDDLPVVRHLDHDPHNARWDNLAWGTHEENAHDMACPHCGGLLKEGYDKRKSREYKPRHARYARAQDFDKPGKEQFNAI